MSGTKQQGPQSADGPAATYRKALAALDRYCRSTYRGKLFPDLSDEQKDELLKNIEDGKIKLEGVDGQSFFAQVIKNMQEGFFADPLYGGNRDMVGWKMIGYPGARYNYLDWVERHNERFPLPPVSLIGRADWSPKT
jgi:gluconate 2-dehydrogenase gamma chain